MHSDARHRFRTNRVAMRYAAPLRARFGLHGLVHEAPVANISETGICLRTNHVYKTGSRVLLRLELPDGDVHLKGEVMWAIRVPEHETATMEHGMGLQFIDSGSEWKHTFERWRRKYA